MPDRLSRITGLRVRVKDVLDMPAGGSTRAQIFQDYPCLEDEDITAALEFASRATDHPVLTNRTWIIFDDPAHKCFKLGGSGFPCESGRVDVGNHDIADFPSTRGAVEYCN